ncbi:uncharacterized protein LOC125468504 [Pyrus x bretschneideri]|uniref:uncharacterized protein LOC125468504 n=1 Tax=Pyrus x bretschneideri TaxID=225117 RepID=UPI00202E7498|nr:uncharacterized protein LOC125468504 [Pyrus x bretschneideri]
MGDKPEQSTSSGMTLYQKWEHPNHPLYLHHSDQPGAVLVPQPLVEDNYGTWAQSMTMALMVKNKLGLVDGTITKPTDAQVEELQQWNRCNNLVKTWLLGSMSKEISGSVIYCKDARQMWLDLNTLLLDPLPTVNKAYALVLRHEKQVEVSNGKGSTVQLEAAMFAVRGAGREPETEDGS